MPKAYIKTNHLAEEKVIKDRYTDSMLHVSPMRTKVNRQNRFGDFRLLSHELDVCLSPIRNSELLVFALLFGCIL